MKNMIVDPDATQSAGDSVVSARGGTVGFQVTGTGTFDLMYRSTDEFPWVTLSAALSGLTMVEVPASGALSIALSGTPSGAKAVMITP